MSTSAQDNRQFITDKERARTAANANLNLLLATYGAKWSGRKLHCPWPNHDDKHASASIKNGNIKCWSCGKGGDCFEFVMAHEKCTFPDAVKKIAEIYGIHL